MPKYGRGLGREIFEAVKRGDISQPFNVSDCRTFALSKNWNVPESYLRVALANSEVDRDHSETYKNYFVRVSNGMYEINQSL